MREGLIMFYSTSANVPWTKGFVQDYKIGSIHAEEQAGRKYFFARVTFPESSGWWPRTTETCSLVEAREWIDRQDEDYKAKH